jgi:UDPglucose--hexose-1-phosphate uridylyltransferase
VPGEAAKEDATQREHHGRTGRQLLLDIADIEAGGPRVVSESPSWLVVVPFWAVWPFETLIVAREPTPRLTDLSEAARDELASLLRDLVRRYDACVRGAVPVLDGLAWGAVRRGGGGWRGRDRR